MKGSCSNLFLRLMPVYLVLFVTGAASAREKTDSFYREAVIANSNVAKVVKKLKSSIENGGGTVRLLKFSDVVKEQGGSGFPDYSILMACGNEKNMSVIRKDPALVNLLPCSIVVFDAGRGKVKINVADAAVFASAVNVSASGKRHVVKLYAALHRNMKLKFHAGKKSELTDVFQTVVSGSKDSSMAEFNTLLVSSLQGENLNVLFSDESNSDMTVHFVCSAGLGNVILKTMPEFGVFAPCRLLVIKGLDNLQTGFLNIGQVVKSNEKRIGQAGMEAAGQLDKSVKNALEMVTGM